MTTNNKQSGFTPTPTLASFRFLKSSLLGLVLSAQELISAKNAGETKKQRQSWCRGFTLVETLIAIAILLVAVVGPISLVGDSLHKIYYAKDEMIAINLAQEGIEVVRQIRDSNMLAGVPWGTGLADGSYVADAFNLALSVCGDTKVYQDATGYRQLCAGGTSTQFTSRIVTIVTVAADEKRITSTVTWNTGGNSGTVTASENIFKWTP